MRKVSLEMNLGKKSKARFPRRVQNNLKLKIVAPASEAKPLPPLGPALTLFGVDARGFCEDFNHMSKDFDTGFPVSMNIWITSTKSYFYSFRSPSCYNLFHKCFDFYEGTDLAMNKKMLLLFSMNIGLIKNIDNSNVFVESLISNIKQVLGSIRSYGYIDKKIKSKRKLVFLSKNQHIINSKFSRKKK